MFSEVIATISTVDPGTARFISRRLMDVWGYYLPLLGVAQEDFDITTTVQAVGEPDEPSPLGLTMILGGAAALSARNTVESGRRLVRKSILPDRNVGGQHR